MAVSEPARHGGLKRDGHRLQIRVLGPVEVAWDGRPIDIGGVKSRALIGRLLIDRNLVVSVDRLVDSLWGDHDGEGAEIALRSTISRLRRRLRDAGAPDSLIVTRAPGYALDVAAEVTDVSRFENLVAEGRQQLARRRPSEATRLLVEAQELWRGQAYSEVRDEPFARAEARRLEELLLTAVETRMDAGLTMGRHQALAGELETLTSANPLRERLWSQRMLALYRAGRQAEALRVFHDLRTILVAELGIEPGHDVTWMERAILAQDPALDFRVPPERVEEPGDDVSATPSSATYRVRVRAAQPEGPFVGRGRDGPSRRVVVVGARRRRSALARRRRPRGREDAARGGPGAHGRWPRRHRAVGPLRRGPRCALPALRRGVRAILPVAVGRRDLASAGLAALRDVAPRRAAARVRALPNRSVGIRKATASVSSRRWRRRAASSRGTAPSSW